MNPQGFFDDSDLSIDRPRGKGEPFRVTRGAHSRQASVDRRNSGTRDVFRPQDLTPRDPSVLPDGR